MGDDQSRVKTILVADDEEAFCRQAEKYFSRSGYRVVCAYNANQALEMVDTEKPDLVTLDLKMPGTGKMFGLNGLEVLGKIKEARAPMKVVVVSAMDIVDQKDSFLSMGAAAAVRKPVDLEELKKTVESLIGPGGGARE